MEAKGPMCCLSIIDNEATSCCSTLVARWKRDANKGLDRAAVNCVRSRDCKRVLSSSNKKSLPFAMMACSSRQQNGQERGRKGACNVG